MSTPAGASYINRDSDGFTGFLCFILTVAAIVWLADWRPFRSEITVYEATCLAFRDDGGCEAKNVYPGVKTTYRPDRESKVVVYWMDGTAPKKFEDCAIVDAQTWSCAGAYLNYSMVDGEIVGDDEKKGYPRQVAKWEWWWLKLKKM